MILVEKLRFKLKNHAVTRENYVVSWRKSIFVTVLCLTFLAYVEMDVKRKH